MQEDSGVPGRFGFQGACVAMLWPAIAATSVGQAEAHSLHGFAGGAQALYSQTALVVPAAQLDFGARDVLFEAGREIPLALRLPSPDQLKGAGSEAGAFILVRNIPDGLTLSEGMPIGTNWIMSLPQGGRARLMAKQGTSGSHRLEFLLIGPGNRVLAEAAIIVRAAQPKARDVTAEKPVAAFGGGIEPERRPSAPQAAARAQPTIAREEEAILLAKGAELIGQGGIAAARLILEELAQQGSSQGALALARTYDPAYVAAAPTGSIVPSMPEALRWYERAAELGSGEATQRISQINTPR